MFTTPKNKEPQYVLHLWNTPAYGWCLQLVSEPHSSNPIGISTQTLSYIYILGHLFIMHFLLIQIWCVPSIKYPEYNINPRQTPWRNKEIDHNMLPPTPVLFYIIFTAKWFYTSNLIRHTFSFQKTVVDIQYTSTSTIDHNTSLIT